MHDVQYDAHNVLADEEIRQGIKDFSNWPTIPQVGNTGQNIWIREMAPQEINMGKLKKYEGEKLQCT